MTAAYLRFFYFVAFWTLIAAVFQDVEVTLEKMAPCDEAQDDSVITYNNIIVSRLAQDFYVINGVITLHQTLQDNFKVDYVVVKCTSKANPASCEHWVHKQVEHVCQNIPGSGVDTILTNMKLEPRCPIPAGEYEMEAIPFNMNPAAKTVMSIAEYYKIDIKASTADRELTCFRCEIGVYPKKDKSRKKNRF